MNDTNMKELDEQLINTIFQFSRVLRKEMTICSKVAHLSLLQLEILLYLNGEKQAKMNTIAGYFHINKSTASSHLDTLEKMKLVSRKTNTKDRRIVQVVLTSKGKTLLEEGLKEKNKHMSKLLTYISPDDKKTLLKIITHLLHTTEKSYGR